ncbi:UDP-N-acetylmuramoyl-L-alanyl-D-glutamate--2,6-diaminopimelate ligase [Marinomonas sp. S3726]|uniref:UDP-N-acetylmuramoyl-L-alanyl-D-glutamate--2, 6-diaminopimelate ligase n=1 Tax=Marinomonas sp. S3726 TaxID=579484 RepID=UPI000A061FBB|nr:UDP-N-acetylmuramoyl-L-alanyl-D-glutamate--2,6-diaminopimelate ligase [Marinomonas sp. S3726]
MSIFPMPIKSHLVEAFFGLKTGQLSAFDVFENVTTDSRDVTERDVFFALPGVSSNGWDYLEGVAAQGHRLVVLPEGVKCDESLNLSYVYVEDARLSLIQFISQFAGSYPDSICAVTGTNGKSSISYYNAQIANFLGSKSVIVGTFGLGTLDNLKESKQTTPDLLSMHTLAIGFANEKVKHLTFEASSHALDQGRILGLPIDTAIYSNLSRDHLDYHGSMSAYAQAKAKLFAFPSLQRAVICIDDDYSELMLQSAVCPVYTYSLKHKNADFYCENLTYLASGVKFDLHVMGEIFTINLPLLGEFNAANAVASLAANWDRYTDKSSLLHALGSLLGAPGRMQMIRVANGPLVVVDYAHTPDALEVALQALRLHNRGRLTCIYGCGGDRDRGKRPLMTAASLNNADISCLTSDNPRTESVQQIIQDALADQTDKDDLIAEGKLRVEPDRRRAILSVIENADANDVILIAGKGHEDYQEIMGVKHHFDDAEIALEGLNTCWLN